MLSRPSSGLVMASFDAAFAAIAMATTSISADQSRLRLGGPAWMLSDDNPLKQGLPYDGAVEVEVPGVRYDPPVEVPVAPPNLTPPPDVSEVDQILAHLRNELGLNGRVLVHGVAYHGDVLVVLATVEEAIPEPRTVFALVEVTGQGWQHSVAAMSEPVIEVIYEGWREGAVIEVIPDNVAPFD